MQCVDHEASSFKQANCKTVEIEKSDVDRIFNFKKSLWVSSGMIMLWLWKKMILLSETHTKVDGAQDRHIIQNMTPGDQTMPPQIHLLSVRVIFY